MTHDELCRIGLKWLKSQGCGVRISELVAYTLETPDAIGWKSGCSYLIECKMSRSDFHRDKKKMFRERPQMGMGNYRFYLAPIGLLNLSDMPEKWGLLETDGNRVFCRSGKKPSSYKNHEEFLFEKSEKEEIALLVSALRRNCPEIRKATGGTET